MVFYAVHWAHSFGCHSLSSLVPCDRDSITSRNTLVNWERGSPTETLMRYAAFEFTGFLYLCFALILMVDFRNSRFSRLAACLIALDGLGRIGAGVFPCDPGCMGLSLSQNLHHFFATVGFGSGILATIVWGIIFRIHGWPKVFTGYSVGTGISALTFLLLMTWSQNPMKTPGNFDPIVMASRLRCLLISQ